MPELTLTAEQFGLVSNAGGDVLVRDPQGMVLGRLIVNCFSPEEIAEAKRLIHSGETVRTTAEVWERIHAL